MRSALRFALLAIVAAATTGCPAFYDALHGLQTTPSAQGTPTPPSVTVAGVRLEHAPTNQMLAGYYCSQVAPAFVCNLFVAVPSHDDLRFTFAIDLDVRNPNAIPIPVVEMLAAFTAFPAATGQQNLGAACLTFCADPNNCAQDSPNACHSDSRDIRSITDFAQAAARFLIAVADGQQRFDNLRLRTIPANGTARATVRLSLDVDTMLTVVRTLSQDAIQQVTQGRVPTFAIPYRFEGTIWINVDNFGRFAASIPPYTGTWNLQ